MGFRDATLAHLDILVAAEAYSQLQYIISSAWNQTSALLFSPNINLEVE